MAYQALCCFLCHGMVRFMDKNPSDFTNHMITQHKAFFSMEMSLACSLMDEKESQNIIGQHVFPKSYTHKKNEEKGSFFMKEEDVKKEQYVSLYEESNIDSTPRIWKSDYKEVDDVLVKEEADTTQDDFVQKSSLNPQTKSKVMSEKTGTQKRSAEELLTEHEPKLKKTGVLTNNRGSIKDFLDRMRSQSKLFCSVGVDCPKICNSETELSSHKESEHSTDQWKCWEVQISSNGEDGKVLNIENIEVHDIDGPRMNQWTTNIIKQYFFNHINSRIKSLPVSSIPKYALVTIV